MMAPNSHRNLLRGPRCRYCTRKFHSHYITRFLQHVIRHQKHIKPYWYTKSTLPPKAGCVKIKRRGNKKYVNNHKMERLKESLMGNQRQIKCEREMEEKDINNDSEQIPDTAEDYPKESNNGGQKKSEDTPLERNIWQAIKIENEDIIDNLYNRSKEQNSTDERNIWSSAPWRDLTGTIKNENEIPNTMTSSKNLQNCEDLIKKEISDFEVNRNNSTSDESEIEQETINQGNEIESNDLNIKQEHTEINLQTQKTKAKSSESTPKCTILLNDDSSYFNDVNKSDIKSDASDMDSDMEETIEQKPTDIKKGASETDSDTEETIVQKPIDIKSEASDTDSDMGETIEQISTTIDQIPTNLNQTQKTKTSSENLAKLINDDSSYFNESMEIQSEASDDTDSDMAGTIDQENRNLFTEQNFTQDPSDPNDANFEKAPSPMNKNLSNDLNIKQECVDQNLFLYSLPIRSSRRLRKRKTQNDLYDISDADLEIIEQDHLQKAVENSLKDSKSGGNETNPEEITIFQQNEDLPKKRMSIKQEPCKSDHENAVKAAGPNGISNNVQNNVCIKQEHFEHNFYLQNLPVRSSRRLRKCKTEKDFYDISDTELNMIEQANIEKAVENSLKGVSEESDTDAGDMIDQPNENLNTNLNIKLKPLESDLVNYETAAMPNGNITLSNDLNIKQEHVEQNLCMQNLQIRSSRRLRKQNTQSDLHDMSDTELERIEQANIEKALEYSLKGVQDTPTNSTTAICDICVTQVKGSDDLIPHEGVKVCKECFQMLTNISHYENTTVDALYNNTDENDKLEMVEIKNPPSEEKTENDLTTGQKKLKIKIKTDSDFSDEELREESTERLKIKTEIDGDYSDEKSAEESSDSDFDPDRPFKCDVCPKRYPTNKSRLKHHRNEHLWYGGSQEALKLKKIEMKNEEKKKRKEELMKGSRQDVKIRFRRGDLDPSKPFKCLYCPKRFSNKCTKRRHEKAHYGTYAHKCSYCDKSFYRIEMKRYHELEHTGVKEFKCSFCDMRFKIESMVKTHEKIHRNDRQFKCDHCEARFYAKRDMERHQVTHTGDKPFECKLCGKTFAYESGRDMHLRMHTGKRPFKCRFCEQTFYMSGHRKKHEMIHTDERPKKCDYCDKTFRNNSCKESHERTHTGETPFKCKFCDKRFRHRNVRRDHERSHTGEKNQKTLQCIYCPKMFSTLSYAKSHERTHTGVKPYKCRFCPKRFSQSSARTSHERTHTGEKPYKCLTCPAKFSNLGSLKIHNRTHTGEKPYKCSICDKSFRRIHHFRGHELTHKDDRPYKCSHCDKAFKTTSARHEHVKIHTGVRPFNCAVCDKAFRTSSDCRQHQLIHTGEKPFKCPVCLKGFRDRGCMKKHERVVHEHAKEHQCSFCPQRFGTLDGKRSHERLHTGEMPYQCEYCPLKFRHAISCKRHERKHTGEQPSYKCAKCSKVYVDSSGLKRHEKSCHSE